MASFEKYENKAGTRYRVRYRDPQNKSREKSGFTTLRAAKEFSASIEVSKMRGEYIDSTAARALIGDLGQAWLGHQGHLKPASLRPIESAWRTHVAPRWANLPVARVRHSDVQAWVTELTAAGLSPTSVIRAHGILAAILGVAVKDRRITTNAALGVNKPRKQSRAHVYLTHQQVHDLASNSGDHQALVLVLAYCGLRWGEAIGLRVGDLDLLRRRITVSVNAVEVGNQIIVGTPKSHKTRMIVFPQLLANYLARACEGKSRDDLVFSDAGGQHMRRVRVSTNSRSWFKTALKEAGLPPMTLHDLRHTAASLAVSANGNVKAVQRMLGHASAAMTLDVYADLFADDLETLATSIDDAARAAVVGKVWGFFPDEARQNRAEAS